MRTIFAILVLAGSSPAMADSEGAMTGAGTDAPGFPGEHPLVLNVYGLAYHPNREKAHRLEVDNEFNPGLGLHYQMVDGRLGVTFAQVGAYYDSGRNWAKFAGLGYQFKLGTRWKVGGALAVMHSRTYNNGTGFVGMIPLVTYDAGPIQVNAVYFPKFGKLNEVDAFGLYLGIPLGGAGR